MKIDKIHKYFIAMLILEIFTIVICSAPFDMNIHEKLRFVVSINIGMLGGTVANLYRLCKELRKSCKEKKKFCTHFVYMNRGKNMCFKKEILLTRDLNQLNRAKDLLDQNNIKYNVVTNTVTNPGRHHGVPFINMSEAFQYHIFVKRRDFNIARRVLGN